MSKFKVGDVVRGDGDTAQDKSLTISHVLPTRAGYLSIAVDHLGNHYTVSEGAWSIVPLDDGYYLSLLGGSLYRWYDSGLEYWTGARGWSDVVDETTSLRLMREEPALYLGPINKEDK